MPTFRRFLTRRWLLGSLAAAALLFGVLMLHPYPRQTLFGPTIRGKPWCVWADAVRRQVHWGEYEGTFGFKLQMWLGIRPVKMKPWELFEHVEMTPLLVHMSHDPDLTTREDVIYGLHMISRMDGAVFSEFVPLAKHSDEGIRHAAMFMMQHFGKRSIPIFVAALDDPAEDVRWQAAWQLENLGPQAIDATPSLERHLEDRSPDVRKMAFRAIGAVNPERFQHLRGEGEIE